MSGAPPYPFRPVQPGATTSSSGGGVGGLLRELHIPWPAANEGDLQTAASAWTTLAESIRDAYGSTNSTATGLTSNNEGAAITAFEKYWSKFGGSKGALPLAAEACDSMAKACSQYASDVAETKHKIEEAGAEVAATLVIGTIGAFFTFGATEAIADSVAAGLLSEVEGFIEALGLSAGIAISGVSETAALAIVAASQAIAESLASGSAAAWLSTGVSGAATGVGGTLFSSSAESAVSQLFGDGPIDPSDEIHDLIKDGLIGGATGGVVGKLGDLSAEQLSDLLENAANGVATTNPQLFVDMMTVSKQIQSTVGKLSTGVLSTAATQLLLTQQIDAEDLASDQLLDQLKKAAGAD